MKTPDKEAIERLYVAERRTLKEIAEMYQVTIAAVRQKMDRLGIARRTNSEAQQLSNHTDMLRKEDIEHLYFTEGLSQSEIGTLYGITQGAIKERMKRYDIRTRGKAHPGVKNGMYGRTHTPEAREKIRMANKRQFSDPAARERHAILTTKQIAEGQTGKAYNKLEQVFASMLQSAGITCVPQYRVGRFLYDFYLPDTNTLIEIHGTFWHADPRFYSIKDYSAIQHRNTANDQRKADRAKEDGYNFLTFWEHDIYNAPIAVIAALP